MSDYLTSHNRLSSILLYRFLLSTYQQEQIISYLLDLSRIGETTFHSARSQSKLTPIYSQSLYHSTHNQSLLKFQIAQSDILSIFISVYISR